jgi:hypothetical protein
MRIRHILFPVKCHDSSGVYSFRLIQASSCLDTMVPVQQTMIFMEKLEKYVSHDRFEFDIIERAGHGDPFFETGENMKRVFAFVDQYLK